MDRWQYWVDVLSANATEPEARAWLNQAFPGWKPSKYAAASIVPVLNRRGAEGWELISIQPLVVGNEGNVTQPTPDASMGHDWTSYYLCTFKRRVVA